MKETLEIKIEQLKKHGVNVEEIIDNQIKNLNKKPAISQEMLTELYNRRQEVCQILNNGIVIDTKKFKLKVYPFINRKNNNSLTIDFDILKVNGASDIEKYIMNYDSYILSDYLCRNKKFKNAIIKHSKVKALINLYNKKKKIYNKLVRQTSKSFDFSTKGHLL